MRCCLALFTVKWYTYFHRSFFAHYRCRLKRRNQLDVNCQRFDKSHVKALLRLSAADGFPYRLTQAAAALYCRDKSPSLEGAQTYGIFADNMLVSVMTATFCMVFPCDDSPSGRIVHISGAYTLPAYRHRHHATALLTKIQSEAEIFGADYLCCDSTADGLYLRFGMEPTDENETRMWKRLFQSKEEQP